MGDNKANPTGIHLIWIRSLAGTSQIATFGPAPPRESRVSEGAKLLSRDFEPLRPKKKPCTNHADFGYTIGHY